MKTNNSLIENMELVRARAAQLDCTVVAVIDRIILCRRADNTFITWRAAVYIDDEKNGAIDVEFISGCYDMTAATGTANLIERVGL